MLLYPSSVGKKSPRLEFGVSDAGPEYIIYLVERPARLRCAMTPAFDCRERARAPTRTRRADKFSIIYWAGRRSDLYLSISLSRFFGLAPVYTARASLRRGVSRAEATLIASSKSSRGYFCCRGGYRESLDLCGNNSFLLYRSSEVSSVIRILLDEN